MIKNKQTYLCIKKGNVSENKKIYSVYRNKKSDSQWKGILDESIVKDIKKDIQHNNIIEFTSAK